MCLSFSFFCAQFSLEENKKKFHSVTFQLVGTFNHFVHQFDTESGEQLRCFKFQKKVFFLGVMKHDEYFCATGGKNSKSNTPSSMQGTFSFCNHLMHPNVF